MPLFSSIKRQMGDSPLLHQWRQLQASDRLALSVLLGFLSLVLLYLLLWQPVSRRFHEAEAYYREQAELHAYLLHHADRVRQLSSSSQERLSADQLQSLVTATAQKYALSIERLNRDGETLQLVLVQADFKKLLSWLKELQEKNVVFAEVSLRRTAVEQVETRLSLTL